MAQLKFNINLSASTLLEALVAMILLLICIIIATSSINNVIQSSYSIQQFKATLLSEQFMNQVLLEEKFIDEEVDEDGISLQKRITLYPGHDDIIMVVITARNQEEKVLAVKKKLFKSLSDD